MTLRTRYRDWTTKQIGKSYTALEKQWLKNAATEEFTVVVSAREVDILVERGWQLVNFFSDGFTGVAKAVIKTTQTELRGRL